jgi:protein-disulfide isomerase
MTLAAILVGVLIVVIVAIGQLGNRLTGTFTNPAIAYPADIQHDNTLGSASAPVLLEVYGDFQCPICARHSLDVEPSVVSKYVIPGKVRIVHHDIAILGRPSPTSPDNESRIAASGAVCAIAQGKYWDYAHWIFANQDGENAGGFTRERVTAIATAAGLDGTALRSCLDQPATTGQVDANTQQALAMGINATPTLYLNGTSIGSGLKSVDQLSALIDAVLAGRSASPSASAVASPAASASASP